MKFNAFIFALALTIFPALSFAASALITTLDQAAQLCPGLNTVVFQPVSNSQNQGRLVAAPTSVSPRGAPYCAEDISEAPANMSSDGVVQGITYSLINNDPSLGYGLYDFTDVPQFISCSMSYQGISGNQVQIIMMSTYGKQPGGLCTPPSITNVKTQTPVNTGVKK